MITKAKIINNINDIRNNTSVKFKNFGGFVLRLMMLSIEDQEFVVDNLIQASKKATPLASIVISSVKRVEIIRDLEFKFRFILEYEFKCNRCSEICIEKINLNHCKFECVCESCRTENWESYD